MRKEDFFVDPDIRKAETLPPRVFTDERFAELERDTVFQKSWLLVPASHEMPFSELLQTGGSRYPFTLLDRPLMLIRDNGGTLRCLSNVCTHAGNVLVEKPGCGAQIVCGVHGRRFSCDGKFKGHRGFNVCENFPREEDHLREYQLIQWDELKFVAREDAAVDLAHAVTRIIESAHRFFFLPTRRVSQSQEVRDVCGNWKLHVLNFLDEFHIPSVHRNLAKQVELSSYRNELYSQAVLQWVYAKDPAHGFDPERLSERFRDPKNPEKRVFALWWFVFPNMAFDLYPWGLSVYSWMPIPGKPEQTRIYWNHFVTDEEKYALREEWWRSEEVDREDTKIIEGISRGVRSPDAVRGRFAPEREMAGHWFHRKIYEMTFGK